MVAGNRHSGSVKVAPFRSALREYGRIKICCKNCKAKVYEMFLLKGNNALKCFVSSAAEQPPCKRQVEISEFSRSSIKFRGAPSGDLINSMFGIVKTIAYS